jgi:hypothetical protein
MSEPFEAPLEDRGDPLATWCASVMWQKAPATVGGRYVKARCGLRI